MSIGLLLGQVQQQQLHHSSLQHARPGSCGVGVRTRPYTMCTCLAALQSNSHLWWVNGSTPVYIYGTLHVPYPQLWDSIPHNVKVAFTSSTDFYLELDTSQSEVMQKVKQLRLLPEGQTLRGVISRELYNRVEGYIRRLQPLLRRWIQREAGLFAGFYVDQMVYSILGEWQRMRPVWLLNLLNSLTEQQVMAGGSRPLLDIFLRQAAEGMGKQVHALESVEDQMEPLSRLSLPEVGTHSWCTSPCTSALHTAHPTQIRSL